MKLPVICAFPEGIASVMRGAETTNPSSTIATWLVGSGRDVTRAVSAPNAEVPSLLNVRLTNQALPACVSKPADALEICRPSTSAGAKMYFVPPARSQVTRVSVGASTPVPCKFSALVQSRVANFAFTSALTPATGVAAVSAVLGKPEADAST